MNLESNGDIQLEEMVQSAVRSANGEAYRAVFRREDYRAGIIVAMRTDGVPTFSVELLLRIFRPFSTIDPPSLARVTEIVRQLSERGYSIAHEDDGWLCCKRLIERADVKCECELLQAKLKEHYKW